MSGHAGSDILDATNHRRNGLDVLDTVSLRRGGSVRTSGSGVVSQSVVRGKLAVKKTVLLMEIVQRTNTVQLILRNYEVPDHILFDGLTTMTVTAYSPTEEHALDIHGVKKILQVENTIGRDINGRRGSGSLSVLDVIDANRRAGSRAVGTSNGIGNDFLSRGSSASRGLSRGSIGGKTSVSKIITGSSAGMSRALSDDDSISNCHYGCGGDKLCRSGHKCIHNGCSSYCVEISSESIIGASGLSDSIRREIIRSLSSDLTRVSSKDGHLSSDSRIGSSCLARNLELSSNAHLETIGRSRGMSGHAGSDATNFRRSGLDVLDTDSLRRGGSVRTSGSGVVSQSVVNGAIGCKKECHRDGDCPTNKYCATVNCHMICRRRPSNGYTR
ncbi:unnamed protein product [Mytilus coruscus]|uniref:WAP domain-containing protein n=1 Tax=Mytilus coruscus TaxID=42192 RepID=A0A6J8BHW7_MYTCO|nr:unnamed protein product [Mytilus coruscus]